MVSTPKNPNLRPNDPYQDMEGAIVRPSHIKKENLPSAISKQQLKSAEQEASRKNIFNPNNKDHENSHQPLPGFQNKVKGRSLNKTGQKKGFLKSKGPLAFLLSAFFGASVLFLSGQSILGPHLSALYTEATDVQFTSYSLRNQRLFSFMLDGGNQIRPTVFSKKFTTFTPYMKSRLAKNNIEVGSLNSLGEFEVGDLLAGKSRVLRYKGEIINASDFQTKYASDIDFRESYYKAKRGRVAGFFDDASDFIYRKLGLTRNVFKDYSATGDKNTDVANFKDTLGSKLTGADADLGTARHESIQNEDGTSETYITENETTTKVKNTPGDAPTSKARNLVSSVAGKVSAIGGPTCAALRVANMVNIAAFAYSLHNSINYFMGMMENISKMMSGEGDATAVNDVLNFLTTSTTSEVEEVDKNGQLVTTQVTGAPIESNGSRLILGSTPAKSNTNNYSLEAITSAATRTVLLSGATSVTCSGIQAASAIVSLTATAIPGGSLAKIAIGMLAETFGGIIITGIVSSIISAIVPILAKALFTNVLESYTGIPAGEFFSQGAAASNFGLARSASAYMPASEEKIAAQSLATTTVLAQEAEIERNKRSPFDISSPHTFLGSLATSTLPFLANSNPAITTPINIFANLSRNALNQLTPAASATSTKLTYATSYGDCPALESVGAKGDIYCNPIPATDLSTIEISPDDSKYEAIISSNLESDASSVKNNSELAKFINFCTNRESPFGVTDANILNALQTDFGIVINNMPFLNDIAEIVNAVEDSSNQAWATGANCINSNENPRWDNEFKYYQRYVEDTRLLDQMGAYEDAGAKNPILAYQEAYEATHPLDNSAIGILSRITGYTKDDIAFLFDYIEYTNFIAEYNAAELAPLAINIPAISPLQKINFNHTNENSPIATIPQYIIYNNLRYRSFAA